MGNKLRHLFLILCGIFLGFGIFFSGNFLINMLDVTGENLLANGNLMTHPNKHGGKVISLERSIGPRVWTKLTKNWGPHSSTSKRHEFPGYTDPVPRKGVIRNRRSRSKNTVGSAVAILSNGAWITAKHVIDGCKNIIVQAGLTNGKLKNLKPTRIYLHKSADIALIKLPKTDYTRKPFLLNTKPNLTSPAFHIGFPTGKPGAVKSNYLGRMKVRRSRRGNLNEDLLVWAERSRVPNISGSLGGISGGATIDSTGTLIGINSAASVRRGRILSSSPKVIRELIYQSEIITQKAPKNGPFIAELIGQNYPIYARAAIQDRRIVRIICQR